MTVPGPAPFRRLYIEPIGGVAGDMLLAALIDLGADREAVLRVFASLDIPDLQLRVDRVEVDSEPACFVRSLAPVAGGHGRRLADIVAIIDRGDMPDEARSRAIAIFELLAGAEAVVHGGDPSGVHLHEVGELDSIMDVVGFSVALHSLGDPPATAAPLPSGAGTVVTAHGTLSCPVPAVRVIAERAGVPLVAVEVTGETITPTGIAVVATVCESFEVSAFTPGDAIGVGAGKRRFAGRPNVVRIHGWR